MPPGKLMTTFRLAAVLQSVKIKNTITSVFIYNVSINYCSTTPYLIRNNCEPFNPFYIRYPFWCTVKTLKIGTPRPTTVAILNIKQYDFTMQ